MFGIFKEPDLANDLFVSDSEESGESAKKGGEFLLSIRLCEDVFKHRIP